jgi:hypothetical protein
MDCKSVTSTGTIEEYVRDPEGLLVRKVASGCVRRSGTFVCSSGSVSLMWCVAAQ